MAPNNTNSRELLSAIGGVSRATGVNIETIRYYERIGLLTQPIRNSARHRRYSSEHQQRLWFIRRARVGVFHRRDQGAVGPCGRSQS